MSIRTRLAATTVLGAALLLAGCGSPAAPAAPPAGGATIPVVTSTNVYGSIAQAVGGDHVTVTSLINDPSADPHTFEATPADSAKVAEARIVVANGGGYDDFVTKLVDTAGGGDRKVIDVVELSGLKPAGTDEFNEHVWYSLPTVTKLAGQLATDLAAADPANADAYRAGAAAFTEKITGLETKVAAIKAKHAGERVAITEPVPGYLIDAAGLTNATPDEYSEAIEEDTDPPAAVLQQTLDLFTGTPVRALVLNSQTQTPTTDQVKKAAETAGVPVVNVTETLPSGDYVSWMSSQIDALAAALNR